MLLMLTALLTGLSAVSSALATQLSHFQSVIASCERG